MPKAIRANITIAESRQAVTLAYVPLESIEWQEKPLSLNYAA
jgi:hypothetical protein